MTGDWLVAESLAPDPTDDVLAPLYEGAARGVLVLPFCGVCDQVLELDQQVCDRCRSVGAAWREVEPAGVVHTATLVHRLERDLVMVEHPYPVLDVETTSGHRVVMTTRDDSDHAPAIGTPVSIGFRRVGTTSIPAAVVADDPSTIRKPVSHTTPEVTP